MIDKAAFFDFARQSERLAVELPCGTLYVRPLTVSEDEQSGKLRRNSNEWQAFMMRVSVCDEDGNPFFIENDDEALAAITAKQVGPLIEAILIVNGWITDDDDSEDDEGN